MLRSQVHFQWSTRPSARFTTGVSLHGHTLLSRESLGFIRKATATVPWLSGTVQRLESQFEARGRKLNLSEAWWTPLLSPRQAFDTESRQIESVLGLKPLVSLTDHDDPAAGLQLRAVAAGRDIPVSVEWTVPFRQTFFHVGLHNISPSRANTAMAAMRDLTHAPNEKRTGEMLASLAEDKATLIVFNHPAFDESHVGPHIHNQHVHSFLHLYRRSIHAIELNGLRSWKENRIAARLAQEAGLPVVSGGDRHGREPNACLNLTNARTFAEFVNEVRHDGLSQILFMPQYRESLLLRVIESVSDVMQPDPHHALGWTHWSDRIFCETEDGVRSLAQLWGGPLPSPVNQVLAAMRLLRLRQVRSALRFALTERGEFVL